MDKRKLLEKLNEFYIYANEGLYIDKVIKKDFYTMAYSKYVKDYDCNYVTDIKFNGNFRNIENDVKLEMKKVNRKPCYIITPISNIYNDRDLFFDKNRYEEVSNEVWQIYDDFQNVEKIDSKTPFEVKLEKTNDMKKLAEITYKAFSTGDESDPYGDFDKGYLDLYRNYNKENKSKYTREFYFVKVNSEIIGCTVNVYDDEIFGIYGIAIMKEYRGKGIGTEVIKQQLQTCKEKNKKLAFLQTEEGFYPANLYRKIGFKDVCNVFYYVEKN
ncbi:MAG: GNAT family N-acetyltransferase [Candidatus Scatovivens sp.]